MFKNLILTSLCSFILIAPSCVQTQDHTADEVNLKYTNTRDTRTFDRGSDFTVSTSTDEASSISYTFSGTPTSYTYNFDYNYWYQFYYYSLENRSFDNSRSVTSFGGFVDLCGYLGELGRGFGWVDIINYGSVTSSVYRLYFTTGVLYFPLKSGMLAGDISFNIDDSVYDSSAHHVGSYSLDTDNEVFTFYSLDNIIDNCSSSTADKYNYYFYDTFHLIDYVVSPSIANYNSQYFDSFFYFYPIYTYFNTNIDTSMYNVTFNFSNIGGSNYQQGYDAGFVDGKAGAYDSGYQAGESAGYDSGYSEGESVGYDSGYDEGYDSGYAEGESFGYTNGFNNGVANANDYSFTSLFASIADTPILMLRSLFNFDFFGINLLTVVLSLFTALIVVYLIRKLL